MKRSNTLDMDRVNDTGRYEETEHLSPFCLNKGTTTADFHVVVNLPVTNDALNILARGKEIVGATDRKMLLPIPSKPHDLVTSNR